MLSLAPRFFISRFVVHCTFAIASRVTGDYDFDETFPSMLTSTQEFPPMVRSIFSSSCINSYDRPLILERHGYRHFTTVELPFSDRAHCSCSLARKSLYRVRLALRVRRHAMFLCTCRFCFPAISFVTCFISVLPSRSADGRAGSAAAPRSESGVKRHAAGR